MTKAVGILFALTLSAVTISVADANALGHHHAELQSQTTSHGARAMSALAQAPTRIFSDFGPTAISAAPDGNNARGGGDLNGN